MVKKTALIVRSSIATSAALVMLFTATAHSSAVDWSKEAVVENKMINEVNLNPLEIKIEGEEGVKAKEQSLRNEKVNLRTTPNLNSINTESKISTSPSLRLSRNVTNGLTLTKQSPNSTSTLTLNLNDATTKRPNTAIDINKAITKINEEKLLIEPVPYGSFNSNFLLGKPQTRDVGETIYFNSTTELTRIEFQIAGVTLIMPEYHRAKDEDKHKYERPATKGQYGPIEGKINVSLWHDEKEMLKSLPERFDLKSDFSKIIEFDVTEKMHLGKTTSIDLPTEIELKPGYYYLNLYFTVYDLNITTIWVTGRQSGNNKLGGLNKDMPTTCEYTPAKDLYPDGQAYYSYQDTGWDRKSPEEKWNYQTPRSYTFKIHEFAKVNECIVIGMYNDILNTGDIFLNLFGREK